jgi:putative membrane protein
MYAHEWWHGLWWFMWVAPVIVLVIFAVVLLRDSPRWWIDRTRERLHHHETAREILDRRYASGEITREQYEEMKRVLMG